jgi:hypothetical protein
MSIPNKLCQLAASSVLIFAVSSCGATIDEYKRFASSGKEYATAMDSLLLSSASAFIDSSSEYLLSTDEQNSDKDLQRYKRSKETLEAFLKVVILLRRHNVLLYKYFRSMDELAASDAPQKAQEVSNRIFNELSQTGQLIASTPLFTANSVEPLTQVPSLIVSAKIKGALRAELLARKEIIYKELLIQELAQRLLSQQIRSDLANIKSLREMRAIKAPYVSAKPIESPDKWIALRAEIEQATTTSEALDSAAQTSKELREAFVDLLNNKLTVARANALLTNIRDFAEVAESLRPVRQSKN